MEKLSTFDPMDEKVGLASAVSVSGGYVRCTFEGFSTNPCLLLGVNGNKVGRGYCHRYENGL